jgi:hypothetical protein
MAVEGFDGNLPKSSHSIGMVVLYFTKWNLDEYVCCSSQQVVPEWSRRNGRISLYLIGQLSYIRIDFVLQYICTKWYPSMRKPTLENLDFSRKWSLLSNTTIVRNPRHDAFRPRWHMKEKTRTAKQPVRKLGNWGGTKQKQVARRRTSSHREWFLVLAEKDGSWRKRREGKGDGGSLQCQHLSTCLGQMESPLAFLDGDWETLLQNVQVTIVRQLQVVDAGHHTGEIVVWCIGMFAWAAHDSKDWRETLEPYNWLC